jgi:hypothetical protein
LQTVGLLGVAAAGYSVVTSSNLGVADNADAIGTTSRLPFCHILQVLQDVQDVLPPVPDEQAEARQITYETYSTFRMQLAALPEPLLQQVCSAVKGCTLQELLQPLRAIRPVNGGPGWDMDVVMQLRTLNFDLSGAAGSAE